LVNRHHLRRPDATAAYQFVQVKSTGIFDDAANSAESDTPDCATPPTDWPDA
jgi:hypothetical protein